MDAPVDSSPDNLLKLGRCESGDSRIADESDGSRPVDEALLLRLEGRVRSSFALER